MVRPLLTRHLVHTRLLLRERLGVVDGVPREEVHGERRALALPQLREDRALARLEHLLELDLQEVGVGLNPGDLLTPLVLLEELDQLALARLCQLREESRGLEALEERGVVSGQGEGQIGERGHGCLLDDGGSLLNKGGFQRSNLLGLEGSFQEFSKTTKKVFFLFFFVLFGVLFFLFGGLRALFFVTRRQE